MRRKTLTKAQWKLIIHALWSGAEWEKLAADGAVGCTDAEWRDEEQRRRGLAEQFEALRDLLISQNRHL